jgi:N-acyl-phosphatidylethanolamine-hydrolysing phospholipase D
MTGRRHGDVARSALLAAAVVLAAATTAMARPPHHTDDGFRNLQPVSHGDVTVTVPFFFRRVVGMFTGREGAPPLQSNDGTFLRENARHSIPTVTWVGHATVLVQMDHVTFLTDPTWSKTASPVSFAGPPRFVPPGIDIDALPPIDFVVVSHNHYDHLDIPTLRRLSERGTRFFVPLKNGDLLRGEGIGPVEELDWWESRRVGDVEVHCVPAQHWSARSLTDRNRALWSGWAVVGPSQRFYFAGDTGYFDGFREIGRRLGPFGVAALPIGAYEPVAMMRDVHLNPEEAVQAGLDVGAAAMLGVHFGTFDLTDEPLEDPPRRFHGDAARRGIDASRVWTFAVGETRRW